MRYYNSVLGVLWVLIKPYATFLVLLAIWSQFRNGGVENYAVYLLVGIIFYTYFNELIVYGQNALLDMSGIILKVSFPRQIAIIAAMTNAVINLLINMVLITIILLASGIRVGVLNYLYLAFLLLMIFLFSLGISFFTSIINIRFRDLKNVIELGLFLLYWASPIFWAIDDGFIDEGPIADILAANPIGVVINQTRAALGVYGEINLQLMGIYFAVSLVFVWLGWLFFSNKVKRVAEYF